MRTYLNRANKNRALTLGALISFLDTFAENEKDKELLKELRTTKTFAQRALTKLFAGVDQGDINKVIKETTKLETVVRYKDEAVREYAKMLEIDNIIPMQLNDFYDLSEMLLSSICFNCQSLNENTQFKTENCDLRKLLMQYDLPPSRTEVPDGECQYQQ